MSISLCMIVKNEEHSLGKCLSSVQGLFDEIIIVDTGSTDGTVTLARQFTDRVCFFEWCDDFAAARNYSLSLAKTDYAMWLDADDVIMPRDRELLKETIAELDVTKPDVVFMPYNVGFDDEGNVTLSFKRERIIKTGRGLWFEGEIHEAIPPRGRIIHSRAAVTHCKTHVNEPGRNLRIFEKMVDEGKKLSPRHKYYYARELSWADRLTDALGYYAMVIEDPLAWNENRISACLESAMILDGMGRRPEALDLLKKSLALGALRADVACELGRLYFESGDMQNAIRWYSAALEARTDGGFVTEDQKGFIPLIQLCVIYDRLGDLNTAYKFNERAGEIKPWAQAYLYNKRYFEEKGVTL
ncbi:MAG: glycosyltransferase [Oscillospiraceae bacterium]|nr:glycosyltransferase [Oscillospiraceae bacterium]